LISGCWPISLLLASETSVIRFDENPTRWTLRTPYSAAVLVVGNDGKWNMIKSQMTAMYGPEADVFLDLAPQHYHKIVEAFGGYGEYVHEPEQVGPAFLRALESGTPALLNISVRPFASQLCRWLSQGQRYPFKLIGYPGSGT